MAGYLSRRGLVTLFPLTVFTMLPVTGVVPILKQLIQDHYGANDFETSIFMSINMVGALLAAPALGWLSDRTGRTRAILVTCALADALLWWLFTLRPPFALLMALRLVEGVAHIGALSMLMAMMGQASSGEGRRARMAAMGGAVIFGVAIGAPLGGVLGHLDVLLPLRAGGGLMLAVAALAAALLPSRVAEPRREDVARWPVLYAPERLRLPYLFAFVDRLTIGVFIVTFSLYTAGLGFGPRLTGFAIGAFMMTFTVLSYPAGKLAERVGMWPLMLGGSLLFGLAYAAVPWLEGGLLWLVMVVCGTFSAIMFGPNLMLVVKNSTEESRASAMAGFNAAGSLGFLIGPVLGGALLELLGGAVGDQMAYRVIFALVGAIEAVCVGWALVVMKRRPELIRASA